MAELETRPKTVLKDEIVTFDPNTHGVNCGSDGIQPVTQGRKLSADLAKVNEGKELILSECPAINPETGRPCNSTLAVIEIEIDANGKFQPKTQTS